MKKIFTILLLVLPLCLVAQIDYTKEAKSDLEKQNEIFKKFNTNLKKSKDTLKVLTDYLSPEIEAYYKKVIKIKKSTDSLYDIGKTSIAFYLQKGVHQDTINSVFVLPQDYSVNNQKEKVTKEKTYLLFGDENLILKDSILKNPIANKILKNVFNAESETHFGDFWFPMNMQEIPVIRRCSSVYDNLSQAEKNKKAMTKDKKFMAYLDCMKNPEIKKLKFDHLTIDLYEGSIKDIRVYLKNEAGKTFVFENKASISLLRFNSLSGRNYLHNTSVQTAENITDNYFYYSLKVSDILRYDNGLDGNYVPHDVSYTFPMVNDGEKTNLQSSNKYELRQSTALNNVVDLRAYTDVFGLTDASPNGIAHFEGQADFYILPFRFNINTNFLGTNPSVYIFKKIRPYVAYSRFEDEDKFLGLTMVEGSTDMTLRNRLEHLEKSYLNTGVQLDLINFSVSKQAPFEIGFYAVAHYQISRLQINSEEFNYTTLGAGLGFDFEFRRLKNFKFYYSTEIANYNQDSYNDIDNFQDPDNFLVFRNEAEVSYYPSKKKNNTIFLRLRVFDDLDSQEGSNFFQAQFGYKFTIGAGKLKTSN